MKDYLSIGIVPHAEDCTQNNPNTDYLPAQRREASLFAEQIRRYYPEPEAGYLAIKRFPHDFGSYYEVCAVFDDDDEAAINWAFDVENDKLGVLENWDDQSRAELNFA